MPLTKEDSRALCILSLLLFTKYNTTKRIQDEVGALCPMCQVYYEKSFILYICASNSLSYPFLVAAAEKTETLSFGYYYT